MTPWPQPPGHELLRAIAGGEPDAAGTRLLRATRHAKRRRQLAALAEASDGGEHADHWALLAEAEDHHPEAVHDVLHYPAVGGWAEETLRRLRSRDNGPPPDFDRLGALAVAAAVRGGLSFKAVLRHGGPLSLPTLGSLRAPRPGPTTLTERSWDPDDPETRVLHELPGRHVALDDLDPYRAPGAPEGVNAARRLTPRGHRRWDAQWSAARSLLERYDPERAVESALLLRSLVPLASTSSVSAATLPTVPGALFARGQQPLALAATVVHEVQYGKLAALKDTVALYTVEPADLYVLPWRGAQPRPLAELLHGAYARLALAGFWQRAALCGARAAWARHARCRAQVSIALGDLLAAPQLTEDGREFVTSMAVAEAAMDAQAPPGDQVARARRTLEQQRRDCLG
ncbi:aKG-HExxH-type peptide beta-hydroxylase [Streptomyces sp. NPDC006879]|uniref:aKG-HExxH-type peptide beta-hydroxylase n=1 Tax=Streptomyces sp. NPDC006879 TaxID=3364767 RepID=UPI00367D7814